MFKNLKILGEVDAGRGSVDLSWFCTGVIIDIYIPGQWEENKEHQWIISFYFILKRVSFRDDGIETLLSLKKMRISNILKLKFLGGWDWVSLLCEVVVGKSFAVAVRLHIQWKSKITLQFHIYFGLNIDNFFTNFTRFRLKSRKEINDI